MFITNHEGVPLPADTLLFELISAF